MGQKVPPTGLRVGIYKDWQSQWFAKGRQGARLLLEDIKIRKFINEQLPDAGISEILIKRTNERIMLTINTARAGIVIGRGGRTIEELRQNLEKLTGQNISIDVEEVENPYLDAQIVAQMVAEQLRRKVRFRRAMVATAQRVMRAGAKGVKITCSGRLGGQEIARKSTYKEGKLPLATLRADISYGFTEAPTIYGNIGIKVWIYRGDILLKEKLELPPPPPTTVEQIEEEAE